MRYLTQLYLAFFALVSVMLLAFGLSTYTLWQAQTHVARTELTHRVHGEYLALAADIQRLLRTQEVALHLDAIELDLSLTAQKAAILRRLEGLRHLTGQEIEIAGDAEIDELDQLARIERTLAEAIADAEARDRLHAGNAPALHDQTMDPAIPTGRPDDRLEQLLAEALRHEVSEIAQEQSRSAREARLFRIAAALLLGVAFLTVAICLRQLRRGLKRPLTRLQAGAQALGSGQIMHRIDETGAPEFAALAVTFNQMAAQIREREAQVASTNLRLEETVQTRTHELERTLQKLSDTDQVRRQFLADISHELRTPLTVVIGEVDVTLRQTDRQAEEYRQSLALIRNSARHASRIVDDLLFIARAEEGAARLTLSDMDLVAHLSDVCSTARGLLGDTGSILGFVTSLETSRVRADALRVRQVVMILIDNAVRYGGSRIEVQLAPVAGGFGVSVVDDGPGLSDEEMLLAFDRYYRGSEAQQRNVSGSGLGLPLARAVVEAHGGTIALHRLPGGGLAARFMLPALTFRDQNARDLAGDA